MAILNLIEKDSEGSTLNTYNVFCNSVNISWSNNNDAKPYANSLSAGASEVQKNSFENPIYNVKGVTITETVGSLSYNELVRLSKLQTGDTTNYLTLVVDYGVGANVNLIDSAEVANGIKVVIKSFSMAVGLNKKVEDTQRVMEGSITLQESS